MATWTEIEDTEPEFASKVWQIFTLGVHKTIATLRADGSPRISGIELELKDGDVTLGMTAGSLKLRDVRRDPRIAIHSPTLDPPKGKDWRGDAKLAGLLAERPPPDNDPYPGAGHFRLDIREVSLVHVGRPADHLVIESWHEERGWQRRKH